MELSLFPLSKEHRIKNFDCGNDNLNTYIKQYALKNDLLMVSKTYVALDQKQTIAGYITLSNAQISREQLSDDSKLPRYPVPAIRISRLAVQKEQQGNSIGRWLLVKGFEMALRVSELTGVYAMLVDAIDEKAEKFYQSVGFIPLKDNAGSLYISLKTIHTAFFAK